MASVVMAGGLTACGKREKTEDKKIEESVKNARKEADDTPVEGKITYIKSQYAYEDEPNYFKDGEKAEEEVKRDDKKFQSIGSSPFPAATSSPDASTPSASNEAGNASGRLTINQ